MDPNQFIIYRLYRDSTKYVDGHHVKVSEYLAAKLVEMYLVLSYPAVEA